MNRSILSLIAIAALVSSGAATAQVASPLDKARIALENKDLVQAATLLEPLTGTGAKDAAAFYLLSQVRLAQKNAAEGAVLAEKATILDSTKAAYFSQLGVALGQRMGEVGFMQQAMMSGKLKGAFAKAVELDPNDVIGLIGLGRFYLNAPEIAGGSLEKAKEYGRRVQKIDPFAGGIELGQVAAHEEKFDDALKHYESAVAVQPKSANAQYNCGRMLAKLGRKAEARARFEEALTINPRFETARKALDELGTAVP